MLTKGEIHIGVVAFATLNLIISYFLLKLHLTQHKPVGANSLKAQLAELRVIKNVNQSLRLQLFKKDMELAAAATANRRNIDLGGPICVGTDRLIIPVADNDHETALRCGLENGCTTNYSFPINMFSQVQNLPKHYRNTKDIIIFWREDSSTYSSLSEPDASFQELPPPPSLNYDPAFLLDNAVGAHHFGHDMSMYVPLIILLEAGAMDFTSNFVDFLFREKDHPRWKSLITTSLIEDVVLKSLLAQKKSNMTPSFLLRAPELNPHPLNVTCFAHVSKSNTIERYFDTPRDVELFHKAIRRAYPYFTPKMDSCPPQKAIVLYRSGAGAGLRKMLNYDMVEQALLDNGIKNYTNATISQRSSIKDALDLLSSVGLIISTHSSQLKLLAFAHPGTIVIEVRPTEAAKWYGHSVFSEGSDILGVHYISNNKHKSECSPFFAVGCKAKGNIYGDIFVNRTELASAIAQGLEKQQERCPIWK